MYIHHFLVSQYDIRYAYDTSDVLLDDFYSAPTLTNGDLRPGSDLNPVPGLSSKTISVAVAIENEPDKYVLVYNVFPVKSCMLKNKWNSFF